MNPDNAELSGKERGELLREILSLPPGPWDVVEGLRTAADLAENLALAKRCNEWAIKGSVSNGDLETTPGAGTQGTEPAHRGLATSDPDMQPLQPGPTGDGGTLRMREPGVPVGSSGTRTKSSGRGRGRRRPAAGQGGLFD